MPQQDTGKNDMSSKIITITGDLGSGKSTVARKASELTGARRYSTGDAQRKLAQQRGISTLELNILAETDPSVDKEIDSVFKKLASENEDLIVDSRMAWHFLPESVKIRLTVSPEEAAERVYKDASRVSEGETTLGDTYDKLVERRESERRRFLKYYNVDIEDDNNFDFVIDTCAASPDDVASLINRLANGNFLEDDEGLKFWVSPKNIFPTKPATMLSDNLSTAAHKFVEGKNIGEPCPIKVVREGHSWFIIEGHRETSQAIHAQVPFLPVIPVQNEVVKDIALMQMWESAHGFQFSHYPQKKRPLPRFGSSPIRKPHM